MGCSSNVHLYYLQSIHARCWIAESINIECVPEDRRRPPTTDYPTPRRAPASRDSGSSPTFFGLFSASPPSLTTSKIVLRHCSARTKPLAFSPLILLNLHQRRHPRSLSTRLHPHVFPSPLLLATASHSRVHLSPTCHHARLTHTVPTALVLPSSTLQPLVSPPIPLPPLAPSWIAVATSTSMFEFIHSSAATVAIPAEQIQLRGVRPSAIPFSN